MAESYTDKALFKDCYTKQEIKSDDFNEQLPCEFVSRINVEDAFNKIDSDLNDIEYDLNKIKGIAEIDCIKEDVRQLRKKLM